MPLSLLENILKGDYKGELGGPGGMVALCEAINLQAIFWKLIIAFKISCKANETIIAEYSVESSCICGGSTIAVNLGSQKEHTLEITKLSV